MRVSDVPYEAINWNYGEGDIAETVLSNYDRYDPHDPQNHIITSWRNWTYPQEVLDAWDSVFLSAHWSEVEWSTDLDLRKKLFPFRSQLPPVVLRLTARAARNAGSLRT